MADEHKSLRTDIELKQRDQNSDLAASVRTEADKALRARQEEEINKRIKEGDAAKNTDVKAGTPDAATPADSSDASSVEEKKSGQRPSKEQAEATAIKNRARAAKEKRSKSQAAKSGKPKGIISADSQTPGVIQSKTAQETASAKKVAGPAKSGKEKSSTAKNGIKTSRPLDKVRSEATGSIDKIRGFSSDSETSPEETMSKRLQQKTMRAGQQAAKTVVNVIAGAAKAIIAAGTGGISVLTSPLIMIICIMVFSIVILFDTAASTVANVFHAENDIAISATTESGEEIPEDERTNYLGAYEGAEGSGSRTGSFADNGPGGIYTAEELHQLSKEEYINIIGPIFAQYAQEHDQKICSAAIGQVILESGWNTNFSGLALKANNMIGMKAGSKWTGPVYTAKTKEYGGGGYYTTSASFRSYDSVNDCIKDYYEYFLELERYQNLKTATTPRQYLELIRADGYCTSPTYADDIMPIVEKYDLTRFDAMIGTITNKALPLSQLTIDYIQARIKAYAKQLGTAESTKELAALQDLRVRKATYNGNAIEAPDKPSDMTVNYTYRANTRVETEDGGFIRKSSRKKVQIGVTEKEPETTLSYSNRLGDTGGYDSEGAVHLYNERSFAKAIIACATAATDNEIPDGQFGAYRYLRTVQKVFDAALVSMDDLTAEYTLSPTGDTYNWSANGNSFSANEMGLDLNLKLPLNCDVPTIMTAYNAMNGINESASGLAEYYNSLDDDIFQEQFNVVLPKETEKLSISDAPFYYQGDYLDRYIYSSGGTIASGGCGITSFAMVISALKHEEITPPDVVNVANSNGKYNTIGSHNALSHLAEYYGLEAPEQMGGMHQNCCGHRSFDLNYIKQKMSEGHPIIISQSPGYWTSGGHYIAAIGIGTGGALVHDPGSRARTAISESTNGTDWTLLFKDAKHIWIF